MPTVQKRATSTRTASRRRDRVREDDADTTQEEYEDQEETRPSSRKTRSTRSRRERDQDDDNGADDDDEVDGQDDDDDDDDGTQARTSRRSTRTRKRRDDDDDERPARRGNGRRPAKAEGVRLGWDGADETLKAGGSGDWLNPDKNIQLIKFLEDKPLLSCRQHWVETESNTGQTIRRPYVCPGVDCPLCAMGDQPGPLYAFNVLLLSGSGDPKVQVLRLTTTGYQNLKEVSNDRKTNLPVIDRDFFAVQKTGAGTNSARVVFRPVKERDLEDDWDEIFDQFDPDDLPDLIEDAQGMLFTSDVVKVTPRRELEKLVKYLNEKQD